MDDSLSVVFMVDVTVALLLPESSSRKSVLLSVARVDVAFDAKGIVTLDIIGSEVAFNIPSLTRKVPLPLLTRMNHAFIWHQFFPWNT